jgi:hypothetical protein
MLAFTWCYDIPQYKSYLNDYICIVVFWIELDYFHNLPIQHCTTLTFIWTLCGISSSLLSCWTLYTSHYAIFIYICNKRDFLLNT